MRETSANYRNTRNLKGQPLRDKEPKRGGTKSTLSDLIY